MSTTREDIVRLLKARPARYLTQPVYEALVGVQLKAAQALDALQPKKEEADFSDVTALVKTFERPAVLLRLLDSLQRVYPRLSVVVVDDSEQPRPIERERVRTLVLPYHTGISEGRNRGLAQIETELVVLLDDDFVVSRRTHLEAAVGLMRQFREIDILGGQVINLPRRTSSVFEHHRQILGGRPKGPHRFGPLLVYDWVCNFFVARARRLREVGWDPKLKRVEHSDFFLRAHEKLITVFSEDFQVLHAMTPFDDRYLSKRLDVAEDLAWLRHKWGS